MEKVHEIKFIGLLMGMVALIPSNKAAAMPDDNEELNRAPAQTAQNTVQLQNIVAQVQNNTARLNESVGLYDDMRQSVGNMQQNVNLMQLEAAKLPVMQASLNALQHRFEECSTLIEQIGNMSSEQN